MEQSWLPEDYKLGWDAKWPRLTILGAEGRGSPEEIENLVVKAKIGAREIEVFQGLEDEGTGGENSQIEVWDVEAQKDMWVEVKSNERVDYGKAELLWGLEKVWKGYMGVVLEVILRAEKGKVEEIERRVEIEVSKELQLEIGKDVWVELDFDLSLDKATRKEPTRLNGRLSDSMLGTIRNEDTNWSFNVRRKGGKSEFYEMVDMSGWTEAQQVEGFLEGAKDKGDRIIEIILSIPDRARKIREEVRGISNTEVVAEVGEWITRQMSGAGREL